MAERDWHSAALYAGPIHEAIASGDVQAMETLAQRAEREGAADPEIQKALGQLRAELGRLRGQGGGSGGGYGGGSGGGYGNEPRPLYAEAMQQARASGDVQQMRDLAQRARTEGGSDPAIQSALADLEAEIGRSGRNS
jgi:hypothetical protein